MAFKYRDRGNDAWEKRANQQGNEFTGIMKSEFKVYSPRKGDNYIRILPPTWEDADHYGLNVFVHYGIGADGIPVVCPNKMFGEPCPLCEAREAAKRKGDEEAAEELTPRKRVLVWLVDMKEESKGPQAWPMPWTLDRDIAKLAKDPRTGNVYLLDHPDDGYNISFEIVQKGEDNKTRQYSAIQIDRKPSSVADEDLEYVEDHPLVDVLLMHDYEEIQRIYEAGGTRRDRDKGRDDDDRGGRRGRDRDERPARRGREEDDRASRRTREPDAEDERPARRARDDEDERPFRRTRDPEPDAEDERPSRRSRDPDPEDERPARRSRDPDPDDKGAGRSRGGRDEEPAADERPSRRRGTEDADNDEKERPRSSRPRMERKANAEEPPPADGEDAYGAEPEDRRDDQRAGDTRAKDAKDGKTTSASLRDKFNKKRQGG